MVGLAVSILVQFISRTVFIRLLGEEYNGINGLFTNILSVLNLAELGFAYSIAYALYAPLQSGSKQTVCAIMNFLRKIYYIIALTVGVAGVICIPFLQYLIKEDLSTLPFALNQIRIYFAIYLGNTVFSYIWSYKRTLITADQKNYLVSNADNLSNILLYGVQIGLLILTRNYYLYLSLMLVKTVVTNLVLTAIANKRYPYLKDFTKEQVDREERKKILKNVGAMFFHKVGSVIIYGTTTIIISAFVSLVEAGWYTNYVLIVTAVNNFINIVFNSVTASIGNLCVTEEISYQKTVFGRIRYISNILAVFSLVCYLCLFNPFVSLWVGAEQTFALPTVAVISATATLTVLRSAPNTFKNAKGLFVKDWYKPLVEAGVAIAVGIALSFVWGTFGVLLGYFIGSAIALPIEYIVLYKYGFNESGKEIAKQFINVLLTLAVGVCLCVGAYLLCSLLPSGALWFVVKAVIAMVIGASYLLLTVKSDGFAYFKNMAQRLLGKLKRKR